MIYFFFHGIDLYLEKYFTLLRVYRIQDKVKRFRHSPPEALLYSIIYAPEAW